MGAPARIAAFAAALAVLFAGGAAAGSVIDPDPAGRGDGPGGAHATSDTAGHGAVSHADEKTASDAQPVRGLAVADGGLRLVVADQDFRRGAAEQFAFRIAENDGATVRRFDLAHQKRMHLIVVRRDLTGFQHLHPRMEADGTWRTPLRLTDAGVYRVFADFSYQGEARTLASDLRVDGTADLRNLPEAQRLAQSDRGYEVRLDAGRPRAGGESELRFTITRDGEPVHTAPYLGAGGHLVALREGDLAFLHVHPSGHGRERAGERDDSVAFAATFPTEGRYRLFFQFKHEGRVQTVAFTHEVSR